MDGHDHIFNICEMHKQWGSPVVCLIFFFPETKVSIKAKNITFITPMFFN
jgi:hypothetical protein